jgi:uncharacterized protein YlbG (UPF0298 family)
MKKLILLLLFGILSFKVTAQKNPNNYKQPSTAFTTDSLIYLTPSGAVKALQAYSGLYYEKQINRQLDSIIGQLNRSVLIKDVRISDLQNLVTDQAYTIKTQKTKLFWKKVEIWGYRIGLGAIGYIVLFR